MSSVQQSIFHFITIKFLFITKYPVFFSLGLYTLFVLTTSGDMKILRDFNKETFLAGGGKKEILWFDEWH